MDLERAPAPDETTLCTFRHLLETHELGGAMLEAVNRHLDSKGIRITTGTIVDATIIHAPSSTKNSAWERDPEMHQTRKGQAVVLQTEGAHRRGLEDRHRAFGVHHGGIGGRQAHASRPAALLRCSAPTLAEQCGYFAPAFSGYQNR